MILICNNFSLQTFLACFSIVFFNFVHGSLAPHRIAGAEASYIVFKSFLGRDPFPCLASTTRIPKHTGIVVFSYLCSFTNIPQAAFLILAMALENFVTVEFQKSVENEQESGQVQVDFHHILGQYEKLRDAADMVRSLFGNFVIWYFIMNLSFFAQIPQVLFLPGSDVINRGILIWYLIYVSAAIRIAVSVNINVEMCVRNFEFRQQLQQYRRNCEEVTTQTLDHRIQLMALRQDLETNAIGISCYFFTVTKNFLNSVSSYC